MPSPSVITPQKRQPQLEKAKLKAYNGEAPDIELMFNPHEISFSRTVNWQKHPGNRGTTLLPKINFSGVEPYQFTLRQLIFDTYETKESVMTYINIIKKGVETIENQPDTRPPVYTFIWKDEYFYCVMNSLTYTLNMFLTDGTPVRAMVDISLQEVDKNNLPGGTQSASQGQERQDSPQSASLFNETPNPAPGGPNPAPGGPNLAPGGPNPAPGGPNPAPGGPNPPGGGPKPPGGGPKPPGGGLKPPGGGPKPPGGGPKPPGRKK
ncbi:CIS tube protein [Nostoc sp.]|uniref:CIS tube protein n=1 Tax=Nostoc sp. TaxID=1180 RepID=UPI002FFD453B